VHFNEARRNIAALAAHTILQIQHNAIFFAVARKHPGAEVQEGKWRRKMVENPGERTGNFAGEKRKDAARPTSVIQSDPCQPSG
jgi:hypothetical protein